MIKVSDYVEKYLADHGISTVFTVVGGGAMHLNDSFGHSKRLRCVYQHHEQACSMAADAYARVHQKMAAVCVTSGPGATNALTGTIGAYMDSIPMIVISGQAKLELTKAYSGLNVRNLGIQDYDVTEAVKSSTKYAEMLDDPNKIRIALDKAFYFALEGRPGPSWVEIPVDIQGAYVDESSLEGWQPQSNQTVNLQESLYEICMKMLGAKRPIIYAGNGVRIAGAVNELVKMAEKFKVPVVTCWDSIDLIPTDHPLYVGRAGLMGDRAGNFAIQNSDFLLCVGNRLNINQVGYNKDTWAREAYVVDLDIDAEEMKKHTIHLNQGVVVDAKEALNYFCSQEFTSDDRFLDWDEQCRAWKYKYPVVNENHYKAVDKVNVYAFMDALSRRLPSGTLTVAANGSASVVGSQSFYIKQGSRFIMNCGFSSMGYDLPAATGVAIANPNQQVICIAGDGSIQMNLQELQTIVTYGLPVKIFVINNAGYHQIRQTQNNIFHNGLVGVGPESGDLGFPDFEKLSAAYGIPYIRMKDNSEFDKVIKEVLNSNSYFICEVICDTKQKFEPKSTTKKLEDGTLISPPLEDMAPFLERAELESNMYIPLL